MTRRNINDLKKINSEIFPISYGDSFYKNALNVDDLAKLGVQYFYLFKIYVFLLSIAYVNDTPVGGVCCRIEHADGTLRMYIITLGCLAQYRRCGLGVCVCVHAIYVLW